MNRFWDRVLLPIADAVAPRRIVEVGTSSGALTAKLLGWAAARDAVVHTIDPEPAIDVDAWRRDHGERFVFHHARSLNVLGQLDGVELALIDGDHNWYTVTHELMLLERTATATAAGAEPPLVALHDVGWPYGRRDLYYDPQAIPPAHRQPYARKGIIPGEGELSHAGLNDHLQNAIYEHSIRNGVRTAIEDFIAESALAWRLSEIPGLHGLAVLVTAGRLEANPRLAAVLESFGSAPFLSDWAGVIEHGRIEAEIAVSVERAARAAEDEELAAARERFARDMAMLTSERDRLAAELTERAGDNERLEHELADGLQRARGAREELAGEIERLEREIEGAASTEAELRRELAAARDSLEEADGLGVAAAAEPVDDAPLSTGARWAALGDAMRACERSTNETVAERDPARTAKLEDYLAVGRSAVHAIVGALGAAGISRPETILDLPCGYGRVTRALRAAWPQAELIAADQSTAAVAFCVEQFSAEGWEVEDYLSLGETGTGQRDRFDLIWSASLLATVDPKLLDESLSALLGMLRPDGVLVAAYHGRDSARRFSEQSDQGLRTIAQTFGNRGAGFAARTGSAGLGTAAMAPDWLLSHVQRDRQAMILTLTERGWADHLDVVAITRRDVHHSQIDLSALG